MRLTIIGPAFPLRGGIAHHVHAVRRDLIERGHSVQVISFRWLYLKPFFPGKTELDFSTVTLEAAAESILDPLNPLTWFKALKLVRLFAPDAVLFQWWNPFFGAALGSIARSLRRRGVVCIFECHNVIPHEHARLLRPLLHYGLGPVSRFIVHSASDRDALLGIKPRATVKIASLPDIEAFRGETTREKDGRTILFFGLVRRYKGLDVLIEAMPKVLEHLECRLVIAGEFYKPVEQYKAIIRKLDLEGLVEIDNRYIPNEEVGRYFSRADVLVMPYLSATQSGIARIALLNGLPIIASRTGGLSDVVREGVDGLLVSPGDPSALAEALTRYFQEGLGPVFSKNIKTREDSVGRGAVTAAVEELATAT